MYYYWPTLGKNSEDSPHKCGAESLVGSGWVLHFWENIYFNVLVLVLRIEVCVCHSGCQGSISPTFYTKILRVQIPKAKNTVKLFSPLGTALVKAAHKLMVKLTTARAKFHQYCMYSFYSCRSQKRKKDIQVFNIFYAFGIYERKSCAKNVGEFDYRCTSFFCIVT